MIQSYMNMKGVRAVKSEAARLAPKTNGEANKLAFEDTSVHDWYRFVLSFPPHLVAPISTLGITERQRVLDPFCGTGTTIVECKKLGVPSLGIEAPPMTAFASRVKSDWTIDSVGLGNHARRVAKIAEQKIKSGKVEMELSADAEKILLRDSISPKPLKKVLALLTALNEAGDPEFRAHEFLALAKTLVFTANNLNFGPEVGVGKKKKDAPVVLSWLENIRIMRQDILKLKDRANIPSQIFQDDSREMMNKLHPKSINAVITSPPYPNEKDYTRTTRLAAVILGFINNREELKNIERKLIQSNTRKFTKTMQMMRILTISLKFRYWRKKKQSEELKRQWF